MTDQFSIDFSNPPQSPFDKGGSRRQGDLDRIHGDSLTADEANVLRLLEGHKGHENAVTGEGMAEALGMGHNAVRDVIRHLRKHHRLLIGATNTKPQGYFIAVTPEDVDLALRNMVRRAMAMLVMAAQFKKVSPDEIYGQAKMELETRKEA